MAERLVPRLRATGSARAARAAVAAILIAAAGATFVAVYRGTGARIRDQIESDLTARASALAAAARGHWGGTRGRRPCSAGRDGRSPLSPLHVLVPPARREGPRRRDRDQRPRAARPRRRAGGESESRADRRSEASESSSILSAPAGALDRHARGRRRGRSWSQGRSIPATQSAEVIVGQPLAPVDRAQDGIAKTFLIAGSLTLAAALLRRAVRGGATAAARFGAWRRRPAPSTPGIYPPDARGRRRRGRAARRVVQPHARPAGGRVRPTACVRLRRVARAAHSADRDPRPDRGPGPLADPTARRSPRPRRGSSRRSGGWTASSTTYSARPDRRGPRPARSDCDRLQPRSSPKPLRASRGPRGARWRSGIVPAGSLRCDADRLAQVLRNLVRNAIEHTDRRAGSRRARARWRARCASVVDDDGPGIPPGERERVFDRFHRTDESRARAQGGSGLGLAIARAIVEAHGGRIWADASPEGGARLAFELPDFRPD